MAIINNKMHHGIMEALEARARDITIGNHEGQMEQNPWQSNIKDIALGNLIANLRKGRIHLGQGS